jgi:hypothetical protein
MWNESPVRRFPSVSANQSGSGPPLIKRNDAPARSHLQLFDFLGGGRDLFVGQWRADLL